MESKKKLLSILSLIQLLFTGFQEVHAQIYDANTKKFYAIIEKANAKKVIDSNLVIAYYKLSSYYLDKGSLDSVHKYLVKAKSLPTLIPNKRYLANIYNTEGIYYRRKDDYTNSNLSFQKAQDIFKQLNDRWQYIVQCTISYNYIHMANYKKALELNLESLKYFEKKNDLDGIAYAKGIIGVIYAELKDFNNALKYQTELIDVRQKLNDIDGLSATYNRIGAIYLDSKQYNKALEHLNTALEFAKKHNLLSSQATSLNNLGECYIYLHQFNTAIKYIKQSLEIRLKIENNYGIISCYQKLAKCYLELNQFDNAAYNLEKANEYLKNSKSIDRLLESQTLYVDIYAKSQKYKEAYEHLIQKQMLKDSLEGINTRSEIQNLRELYENEKKQKEIELLNKKLKIEQLSSEKQEELNNFLEAQQDNILLKNEVLEQSELLKNNEIERQKILVKKQTEILSTQNLALTQEKRVKLLITTILGFLILGMFFIYYALRREKINALKLKNSRNEIESQRKTLAELNANKDKLFSIISHDLRSPVSSLQSLLWIYQKNSDSNFMAENLPLLQQKINTVRDTLDNLLVWSIQQLKGYEVKLNTVNLRDIINDTLTSLDSSIEHKCISIVNQIKDEIVFADDRKLEIVLRNVLNNAIKFTPKNGFIRISFKQNGSTDMIVIEDTGIGINPKDMSAVLSGFHSNAGTLGETGTGIGLQICKELMALQQGEIKIESEQGVGTTVSLLLPRKII